MTKNNSKRTYTKEFKNSILKRLDSPTNETVSSLAEELNISKSARIGRGLIQDIEGINYEDYDALIIPGGVGLISNYQDSEVVFKLVIDFGRLGKPVGTMCAGIDLYRKWKNPNLMNEEIKVLKANDFCYDQEHRIYYTPAFRKSSNIFEIQEGIDKMILSIIMDLNE